MIVAMCAASWFVAMVVVASASVCDLVVMNGSVVTAVGVVMVFGPDSDM